MGIYLSLIKIIMGKERPKTAHANINIGNFHLDNDE